MTNIVWEEAPEGFPIWIEASGDIGSGWHRDVGHSYEDQDGSYWSKPENGFYTVHYKPEACKQPSAVEWNGDGLPPVGTVCEFLYYDDYESNYLYEKCKVLAHDDGCVIFKPLDGKHKGELFQKYPGMTCGDNQMLRPIKTKEQLEEEAKVQEREKTLSEMVTDLGAEQPRTREYIICGILYDAGYRKMEKTND